MIWKAKSVLACALALTTLSGCATSGSKAPSLPPVPAELKLCFGKRVPAPAPGEMSKQQVADLIAELKRSELHKSQCGQRLIAWYETQAAVLNR